MRLLLAAIAVLGLFCLTGCPGKGNIKHGHVPPGQIKRHVVP